MAYATTYDASDIHAWSGSVYHIFETLRKSGFEVEHIGNLKELFPRFFSIKNKVYNKFLSKSYQREREPFILKSYARQVEKALSVGHSDIVFSPSTIPIALLRTALPVVFWADATFAGMIDFYPEFSNLCRESIRNGNAMEQQALSRCRLAIYASEWAAKTAIENYDVDPQKVRVVPFGANIENDLELSTMETISRNRDSKKCQLLFIGVDWFRKGGDVAVRVATLLNEQGLACKLHLVGSSPPYQLPPYVIPHGFISKRTEEGRDLLRNLFLESHFLIMPSRAECLGVVVAEANSFGLPAMTSDVGGITTAVRNGCNGWAFPLEGIDEKICECVANVFSDPVQRRRLTISSYKEYTDRLNWRVAGEKVKQLVHAVCC